MTRKPCLLCNQDKPIFSGELCGECFRDRYPSAYRRLLQEPMLSREQEGRWRTEKLAEDNTKHTPEQMKYAYGLLKKLKNMIGGESMVMSHWKRMYAGNPGSAQVEKEIIEVELGPSEFYQKV